MAGKRVHKYPPNDELALAVERDGVTSVARGLGLSSSTLRAHLVREGLPTTRAEAVSSGGRTFTLDNLPEGADWTPQALLELVGLSPDEWSIKSCRVRGGHWGRPDDPSSQVRLELTVEPVRPSIKPPDLNDWKPLPKPRYRKAGKRPLKVLIASDHHCPRIEPTFHELLVRWIRERPVDWIVVNGDLLDFPSVSTHRTEDEYNHSVNECLRSGLRVLRDYREAAGRDARITYQRGNHEARLDFRQHEKLPEIRDVAPGGGVTADGEEDARPWHDLSRLLWLDELHIEYNAAPWEQAKVVLSDKLAVRHGISTSPTAGKQLLDRLSGSTIQGHDHRLAMTLATEHTGDPDDPLRVRLGMSGGCCCIIPGGLGYVKGGEPNWQNAVVEVDLYEDGTFHASPIIYAGGKLLFAGGRYVA